MSIGRLPLAWDELARLINGRPGYEGVPGVRSAEYPCDLFDGLGYVGTGRCMSDGHYLCVECSELSPKAPRFHQTNRNLGERVPGALARLDRIVALRVTVRRRSVAPSRDGTR